VLYKYDCIVSTLKVALEAEFSYVQGALGPGKSDWILCSLQTQA